MFIAQWHILLMMHSCITPWWVILVHKLSLRYHCIRMLHT